MVKKKPRDSRVSKHLPPSKTDSPMRRTGFRGHLREVLTLLFMTLLVFLIYSNALRGPFTFDDLQNIRDNPHIRVNRLTFDPILGAAFDSPSSNRPIANISFALNYYFDHYDVLGFHVVNLLIHMMTGVFLYLFAKTTLSLPTLRSKHEAPGWIPLVAVLIWLVHPLQTQSVTYIVQRMNSMAAMFYVLSLLFYAKGRLAEKKRKKWALLGGCILAGLLALGSKEIAVTLPFFIFLYEWYFFQDLSWSWLKGHSLALGGLMVLFAIMALVYLDGHPLQRILSTYAARDFTLTQRVLTEFRVIISYISLLIFPHPSRLNLDHDFPLSHSMVDPLSTVLAIGAIAAMIALAIRIARKQPLLSFCVLWFFGNLVIESSVIGLEIMYEHRTYLPSMLVSLMAVTVAHRYIKRKWLGIGILSVVVVVFSVWTYERNEVWRDDVSLWRDCVQKSPNKARPYYNLGVAVVGRGTVEEAIGHFSKAVRIKPDYAEAHNNLGVVLKKQGRLKEAMDHYLEAVAIKPDYVEAHNNMGVVLKTQGRVTEAMNHYTEALRINPDYTEALNNLGNVLKSQGRLQEAIGHFSKAIRIRPEFAEAWNNLGVALAKQKKFKEATGYFSEALRIKPDYAEARRNLELALRLVGKSNETANNKQGSP
jgi:tetratricopeptide (TPR) repeat protein